MKNSPMTHFDDLTDIPPAITVPDGYNGHTVTLSTEVIQEDHHCVQLHAKDYPGLTRWMPKTEYIASLSRTA